MSNIRKGDAGSLYVQPVPLTARVISNAPENNIPGPTQPSNNTTPKRKTPKRRVKKINIIYRAPRRKSITRSSKSARNTPVDISVKDVEEGFIYPE
jgi:hypothetical protein